MVSGTTGSIASAPILMLAASSDSGCHDTPPLVVSKTPPETPPLSMRAGLRGSNTSVRVRPPTLLGPSHSQRGAVFSPVTLRPAWVLKPGIAAAWRSARGYHSGSIAAAPGGRRRASSKAARSPGESGRLRAGGAEWDSVGTSRNAHALSRKGTTASRRIALHMGWLPTSTTVVVGQDGTKFDAAQRARIQVLSPSGLG